MRARAWRARLATAALRNAPGARHGHRLAALRLGPGPGAEHLCARAASARGGTGAPPALRQRALLEAHFGDKAARRSAAEQRRRDAEQRRGGSAKHVCPASPSRRAATSALAGRWARRVRPAATAHAAWPQRAHTRRAERLAALRTKYGGVLPAPTRHQPPGPPGARPASAALRAALSKRLIALHSMRGGRLFGACALAACAASASVLGGGGTGGGARPSACAACAARGWHGRRAADTASCARAAMRGRQRAHPGTLQRRRDRWGAMCSSQCCRRPRRSRHAPDIGGIAPRAREVQEIRLAQRCGGSVPAQDARQRWEAVALAAGRLPPHHRPGRVSGASAMRMRCAGAPGLRARAGWPTRQCAGFGA